MQSSRGKGGASFPLQIFLLLSLIYSPLWMLGTIGMMVYKGTFLPYADYAFGVEIAAPVLFLIVNYIAFVFGKRGNLMESLPVLVVSTVLIVIVLVGAFYYMWLQTYVTRLDLGLSAGSLGVNSLTLIFCIVALQNAAGGASNAVVPLATAPPPATSPGPSAPATPAATSIVG